MAKRPPRPSLRPPPPLPAATGEPDQRLAKRITAIFRETIKNGRRPDAAALDQLALRLQFHRTEQGSRMKPRDAALWVFDQVARTLSEAGHRRDRRHRPTFNRSAPVEGTPSRITMAILAVVNVRYSADALEKAMTPQRVGHYSIAGAYRAQRRECP